MSYVFQGWIPTVTGRLSLSVFGETDSPSPAITSNVASSETRYILSYQKRNLLDSVIPFKYFLAPKFFGYQGNFTSLCIAKSSNNAANPNDSLCGYLFLFGGSQKWSGPVESKVITKQDFLSQYPGQASEPLERYFDSIFVALPEELKKASSFWVKFSMSRSGVTKFEIPEDIGVQVHPNAPRFPANSDLKKARVHSVASQLFFFLKDIAHVHQHHHPRTDTMIDLYPSNGDENWRCETMRVLQRRIIQYKRISNANVYKSSRGVLAYAKSFGEVCKDEKIEVQPKWHYKPLEDSIQAAQDQYNADVSSRIRKSDVARNWILGLLGIVISMTSILSLTGEPVLKNSEISNVSAWFAKTITGSPVVFLTLYALLYFSVNVLTGNYDISRFKFVRNSVRLLQPYNKWVSASILIFLSFIFFLVTLSFLTNMITLPSFMQDILSFIN